jgi:S1-C subfamily serine protease
VGSWPLAGYVQKSIMRLKWLQGRLITDGRSGMNAVLEQMSDALASVVQTVAPSVVRVEARRRLSATGMVWTADGVLVTAHHVIEQEDGIKVGLPDGRTVDATLIGRDPTTDVAALRVQATGLSLSSWQEASPRVGMLVVALGRPFHSVRAALGIISAHGEAWRTPAGGQMEQYVQPDIVMYPGFSGGPLVDVAGQIVGLNTTALLRGVTLAIPLPTIRRVVDMLLAHGRVRRGYLGVHTQPVRLPAAMAEQLGQETGLLISSVEPASPAEQGGLLLGDTVVTLDGVTLRHHDDLLALLVAERIGSTVAMHVLRGGQVQELRLTLGERP